MREEVDATRFRIENYDTGTVYDIDVMEAFRLIREVNDAIRNGKYEWHEKNADFSLTRRTKVREKTEEYLMGPCDSQHIYFGIQALLATKWLEPYRLS